LYNYWAAGTEMIKKDAISYSRAVSSSFCAQFFYRAQAYRFFWWTTSREYLFSIQNDW